MAGKAKRKISEWAIKVVQLKADLMGAGLIKTAHAMEAAIKQVGWELAEGNAAYPVGPKARKKVKK